MSAWNFPAINAAANGALLIGTGSGLVLATLTGTPNQVLVTNGAGSATLSTPQNIHSTATPTFGALNLGTAGGAAAGSLVIGGSNTKLALINDGGAADNKRYDLLATASVLNLRVVNDADSSAENALQVQRSGATVTGVAFPSAHGGVNVGTASGAAAGQVDVSSAYKKSGTQVVGARQTGWSAWTGTATRSSCRS